MNDDCLDINRFAAAVERKGLSCHRIIVMRRGRKVAEHGWIPEGPHEMFSVSKSFVSVAVGMAEETGKLSTESRAADFFRDIVPNPGERLAALTMGHLLSMTRGHNEFSRPETVAEALSQPLFWQPGTRFMYDNGSTFLASAMFTRAMGITVLDFLCERLFTPMGISAPKWPESEDGHTVGATGLMLSTNEMALFGQLLLDGGMWRGQKLVPREWIDHATRPHVRTGISGTSVVEANCDLGYGLCFWPCRDGAFRADGKNGQFLVVLPRKQAVVAINSDEPRHIEVLQTIWDEVLPLL